MLRIQGILACLMVCMAAFHGVAAGENAIGVVYNDKNGNAQRDPGEKGIPGALVSNGADVVATDKNGRYEIPVTDDTIVFLIKPRGWMTPLGPGNTVPRFYYIHKPQGSPKMKYAGTAPTGPLPAAIDFPLRKQREANRFRILCFGDTQARNVEEVQFLAHDVLHELAGTDAVFGVTLGDNVFNDLSVFEPLIETMSVLGIPWRYVPGNHDHNHDAPAPENGDDTIERFVGPAYYSFNYGPVHFVVLDNIRQEAMKEDYHGGLGERQLAFLKNDLEHVHPKQLVVLLMHIPLASMQDKQDAQAVYGLLKEFPHTFSLSAHTHVQWHQFIEKKDGWPQDTPHHHLNHGTACGSWWGGNFDETGIPMTPMADGGPNNYSFITFDGNRYAVDFRVPRRNPEYQMNLWLPERIPSADTAKTAVVANIFAGSSKSMAEMRIDGAPDAIPMAQFTGFDPYIVETAARQEAFVNKLAAWKGVKEVDQNFIGQIRREFNAVLRGLPKPAETGHLWRAHLPANLSPGPHTVLVTTRDMFGRSYSAQRVFVVAP